MKKSIYVSVALTAAFLTSGCQSLSASTTAKPAASADVITADGKAVGEAIFSKSKKGVEIRLKASNLEPGVKGIHIHETGKCDPPHFKTSGAHFNPAGKKHGFQNPKGHHAGDLPNLKVPESGKVDVKMTAPDVKLTSGSLLDQDGSALIIHEKADDYKTDPSGNSGSRIACAALKGA